MAKLDTEVELLPDSISALCGHYDVQLKFKASLGYVGLTELQCYKRFVNDLKRAESEDPKFPYKFDPREAKRVIKFTRLLVRFNEKGSRVPLRLYPFQLFIVVQLFGWRNKETGLLRFREAYISVGRRNGKSALSSVLLHYYMTFSSFRSERAILFAPKKMQAEIVFTEFLKFCYADPDLDYLYDYSKTGGYATSKGTDNRVQVFSGDLNADGFQSGFAVGDEIAAQTGELYTLIHDGQANLDQCLLIGITTAGFDINGWAHRRYMASKKKLFNGKISDSFFFFVCEPDEDDNLGDSTSWAKANPLLFFTPEGEIRPEKVQQYEEKYRHVIMTGGKDLTSFYTKQANHYCSMQDGKICDFGALGRSYFKFTFTDVLKLYKEWYLGIDLAQTNDLNSVCFSCWIKVDGFGNLMKPDENGFDRLFNHVISFIPEKTLDRHISSDNFDYRECLGRELYLTKGAGGQRTAHSEIADKIEGIKTKYELEYQTIAVDPYGAEAIRLRLEAMCTTYITQSQSGKALSPYLDDFANLVFDRMFAFSETDTSILTRALKNCVVRRDENGYMKVYKPSTASSNYRIDPVDAMIDSIIAPLIDYRRAQVEQEEDYDEWFDDIYSK